MELDEAIELVRKFAKAEVAALAASYLETKRSAFERKVDAAQKFFGDAPMGTLLLSMGHYSKAGDTKENRGFARSLAPREIFLVKQFRHRTLGDLYAVYTSPPKARSLLSYSDIFYVARKDGALKIVSRYARGIPMGPRPLSWEWMGGERLPRLNKPVEVRKLKPPEHPDHRAHYDGLLTGAAAR